MKKDQKKKYRKRLESSSEDEEKQNIARESVDEEKLNKRTAGIDASNAPRSKVKKTEYLTGDSLMNAYIDSSIAPKQPVVEKPLTTLDVMRSSLFDIPEALRVSQIEIVEDDLNKSAGMLTGILEVDLGVSSKVRNIEETERMVKSAVQQEKQEKAAVQFYQQPYSTSNQSQASDEQLMSRFKNRFLKR